MQKHYGGILVGGQVRELSELFAWDREIEEIARPIEHREYASTSKYARTMERNEGEFIEGCDMYSSDPADFYEGPPKPTNVEVDQVALAVQSIFACLHVEERVENGERKRYLHSGGLRKMWETFEFERREATRKARATNRAAWDAYKADPNVRVAWAMAYRAFNSQDSLLGRVEFEEERGLVKYDIFGKRRVNRSEGAYAGEARKALDVVDSDGFILQPTDGGDWVERVTEGWHSPVFVVETEGGLAALTAKEVGDGVVRRKGKKALWLKGALHPASKACRVKGYAPMPFILGYLTRNTTLAAKVKRCWWDPKALLSTLRGEKATLPSNWSRLVAPTVTSFQLKLLEADPSLLDSLGRKEPLGLKYEGVQGYEGVLEAVQAEMINCWATCAQELRSRLWKVRGELETSAEIDAPSNAAVLRLARAWGRIK